MVFFVCLFVSFSFVLFLLLFFSLPKDLFFFLALTLNENMNVTPVFRRICFFQNKNLKILTFREQYSYLFIHLFIYLFCWQIRRRNIFVQREHRHNFNPIYQQMFCSWTCLYCIVALPDNILAKTAVTQILVKSLQQLTWQAFCKWRLSLHIWGAKLRHLKKIHFFPFLKNSCSGCLKLR